ncbi:MAG: hypothetical protein JSV43_08905 [Methanobacteriota archaeon]|nr:MAG: hypothetical protein JSV43_08905 [Euryarchaeota archaeon]
MRSEHKRLRIGFGLFVTIILLLSVVPHVGSFGGDDGRLGEPTPFERYMSVQELLNEMKERRGVGSLSLPDENAFSYYSGPYPIANDDGSLPGVNSLTLKELMDNPPYYIGTGMEVYGASDYYVAGAAHEEYFDDVNGDGLLEWVAFYFDMGLSVNGVDDDGDGCVDEKSNLTKDGQVCDNIPDGVVFFNTGGVGDVYGNLIVFHDIWNEFLGFFRIGSSPRWVKQGIRIGQIHYPQLIGEFAVYYANEADNNINVNKKIGDKDKMDWYVGMVDARRFPSRSPKNHVCRTGYQLYMGSGHLREDGSAVVAFELHEYFDEAPGYDNDYNDDGDTSDKVLAYYIVDSRSGKCRNFVNTGVFGMYPKSGGNVITSSTVSEISDQRDWDFDGSISGYVSVWHDVTSTEEMAGDPYFGHTFSTPVPRGPAGQTDSYGFGFTGMYVNAHDARSWPLEFGAAYQKYVGYPVYYEVHYGHILEEDGLQWTELPGHRLHEGYPFDTPGGICIGVLGREQYIGDINGDGDQEDTAAAFFCPDPDVPGGGDWQIEPASPYMIWVTAGTTFYHSSGGIHLITWPFMETDETTYMTAAKNWHFNKVNPNFEILDAGWDGDGRAQIGGNITGYIDVQNVWPINILCHARLDSDLGWELRSNGCVENTDRDGILHQGETARIHFTLYAPDKEKPGIFTLTVELTLQRITKTVQMVVELFR